MLGVEIKCPDLGLDVHSLNQDDVIRVMLTATAKCGTSDSDNKLFDTKDINARNSSQPQETEHIGVNSIGIHLVQHQGPHVKLVNV